MKTEKKNDIATVIAGKFYGQKVVVRTEFEDNDCLCEFPMPHSTLKFIKRDSLRFWKKVDEIG